MNQPTFADLEYPNQNLNPLLARSQSLDSSQFLKCFLETINGVAGRKLLDCGIRDDSPIPVTPPSHRWMACRKKSNDSPAPSLRAIVRPPATYTTPSTTLILFDKLMNLIW